MNPASTAVALLACCAANAWGQNPPPAQVTASPASSTWSFSAAVYTYLVPDDSNYAQPTLTADRDRLHLEARYNYENLETASVWVGYNFAGGDTLTWDLTPMLGAAFGDTDGIAPGYKGSLGWRKFEFYSEGAFVFARESADSYLYNWSELTFAPVEAFRFGLVTERTRIYQTDRNIQRGLLLGGSFKQLDVTGYLFNLDDDGPTIVLAITLAF